MSTNPENYVVVFLIIRTIIDAKASEEDEEQKPGNYGAFAILSWCVCVCIPYSRFCWEDFGYENQLKDVVMPLCGKSLDMKMKW